MFDDASTPVLAAADTDTDLLRRFESLGSGCEFGFVQRFAGVEQLGLFRFALTPTEAFIDGLNQRFEGVDDPAAIEIFPDEGTDEWLGRMLRYGFIFHTGARRTTTPAAEIHALQGKRQGLLRRLLLEQLETPSRILVRYGTDDDRSIGRIAEAVAAHGPATILWVTLSDGERAGGSVERLGPNLLRGTLDRYWFATGLRFDVLMPQWLSVCRNALRMVRDPFADALLPPLPVAPRRNLLDDGIRKGSTIARASAAPQPGERMHALLQPTQFPQVVVETMDPPGMVRPDTLFALGIEVWIPEEFSGRQVTALFPGLPAVQYVTADLRCRNAWQTVWATVKSPPDGIMHAGLAIEGGPGDIVLSRRWRLEEGCCLLDLPPMPHPEA